jgi:hypothetical protein
MLKLVTQVVETDVDESDLIAPGDAARLMKRRVQSVMNLMATGKLPTYMLPHDERVRPQKFTSKKEVMNFMKRKSKDRAG